MGATRTTRVETREAPGQTGWLVPALGVLLLVAGICGYVAALWLGHGGGRRADEGSKVHHELRRPPAEVEAAARD